MRLGIVIPTYNESKNIENLIQLIFKYNPKVTVVVADDSSPDGTSNIVKSLSKRFPKLFCLTRTQNRGRGAAVIDGFKHLLNQNLNLDYFLEMDADFSHDPKQISRLVKLAHPNKIIVGSRYIKNGKTVNWPIFRVIFSHLANWYIKLVLGVPLKDYTNGFRLYPQVAVEKLVNYKLRFKGYITLSETAYFLHQQGFKFKEVPITFLDRVMGKSNANFKEVVISLLAIPRIRWGK